MWSLKKSILCFFLLSSTTFADVQPLFYETYGFEENDSLNIREKPNYHSKKLGEINLERWVKVFECIHIKKSKWCKVEALDFPEAKGWVNAKYIKPTHYQEGYVTIKGQNSDCAYALKCEKKDHKNKCLVVTSLGDDMEKVSLETAWFERKVLTPATRFSAMPNDPEADGYCTNDRYIYTYLSEEKIKELSTKFPSLAFTTVGKVLKALSSRDEHAIQKLIHPKNGLRLSALSYFNKDATQYFTQKTFLSTYESRNKLFWGQSEAKGEVIQKDLYAYLEDLPSDMVHISKVVELDNLKNYPKAYNQTLKAYEVYWILDEELKEYAYQGLVLILEKYKNQWYVVGISKDYWTP